MSFLHDREYLSSGDVVQVESSHQCNVLVLDDTNFARYRRGERFEYFGGFYQRFPANISVPRTGYWNVTLDLGGGSATIRHGIRYLKAG
ncbi:DUF1883 domain-containing protein [Hypericibacter sp.]|uniref:DUF1883 domain-containing protein n=1 Tax=Hypericibacter sp. TaxID=2705401 RepID=UPI003D6CEF25